jgi:exopolysaccharide biosynthesis predicted pyruvyltransferase EpsI
VSTDLVAGLAEQVTADVVAALGGATECGLVDFPRYLNVGDSVIWAGQRALLRRSGVEVVAAADKFAYSPRKLRRQLGAGRPLLINGGGNFGDLYTSHQELRERVFADFADRPIIQLPQSINFQEQAALDRTRRLIAEHGRVTLLVRDRRTLAFAEEHFEARVALTPDAAFGLGGLPRPTPSRPVARQARTDKELADEGRPTEGTFDWLARPEDPREARVLKRLERGLRVFSGGRGHATPLVPAHLTLAAYDRYAGWNVQRGCAMLGRGERVITDRLHGHIMCVLMGIPHVVLNDRYGKIRDFYDAWTHELPTARLAADLEEATALLPDLPSAP